MTSNTNVTQAGSRAVSDLHQRAAHPVFSETFDELLHGVKSDAIDEIRYVTCFDKSLSDNDYPAVGHVYVTLRKGYAYNIKLGTYKQVAHANPNAATVDTTPIHSANARLAMRDAHLDEMRLPGIPRRRRLAEMHSRRLESGDDRDANRQPELTHRTRRYGGNDGRSARIHRHAR